MSEQPKPIHINTLAHLNVIIAKKKKTLNRRLSQFLEQKRQCKTENKTKKLYNERINECKPNKKGLKLSETEMKSSVE